MRHEHARVIHGYHCCDVRVAKALLAGEPFKASENDYDWLGQGIYFWEYGPDRALRFAEFQCSRKQVETPAVVGAVIHLGTCFDLLDTRFTRDLAAAYDVFRALIEAGDEPMPINMGQLPDLRLRRRDCAMLNWYLDMVETKEGIRYDTVRGCFSEGGPVFDGSGLSLESHIQIAVRNPDCILGVFRPTG